MGCFGDLNLGIGSFRLATILAESYNVCVRFDGGRQARHPRQSFPIALQATTAQLLCSRIFSPPGHPSNPIRVFPPTRTNGLEYTTYTSTLVYYCIIIVCSALPWPGQRRRPVIFAWHLMSLIVPCSMRTVAHRLICVRQIHPPVHHEHQPCMACGEPPLGVHGTRHLL